VRRFDMNMEESASTERGQVLVIMVFGMVVLLIIAGLAIDGGTVFMERRHAQNAADAAALAGARKLAEAVCGEAGADDAAILAQVIEFVAINRVNDPENSVRADYVDGDTTVLGPVGNGIIPIGATGISATVGIERSTYFMSLIGIDTSAASAYALAMTGPPLAAGGLRPFGIPREALGENPIHIDFDHDGGDVSWGDTITPTQHRGFMNLAYVWNAGEDPGFPRAVDESANANVISEWMENGFPGLMLYPDNNLWSNGARNGDFIHAKPGTMAGAICDAPLNEVFWIPIYDAVPDCETELPGPGVVPRPDCPTQGSGYVYHIYGIASVMVTECNAAPEHEIVLRLERSVLGEGIPDLSGPTGFGEAHACDTYTQVVTLWE
jgi:hypothetical protein